MLFLIVGLSLKRIQFLNFPAVTIRNAYERPEGMDASSVILSNLEPENIVAASRFAILFSKKDLSIGLLLITRQRMPQNIFLE